LDYFAFMETAEVLEISRDAIFVLLKTALPLMLVALVVGVIISLFQALTQIQEMTLSFVPKIVAIFLTLLVALPFILDTLRDFTLELFSKIAGGG
jgi:flagellar biosynthetic protein FliQ